MTDTADSQPDDIVKRLHALGIETGVSRSGRILRIDNRKSLSMPDAALLAQALDAGTLREIFLHGPGQSLNEIAGILARQSRLQVLDVENTSFSDESIGELQNLAELRLLNVRNTAVTAGRIAALRKIMIGTRIIG